MSKTSSRSTKRRAMWNARTLARGIRRAAFAAVAADMVAVLFPRGAAR